MTRTTTFYTLLFVFLAMSLSSCLKDDCQREVTYLQSTPIYKTKAQIRLEDPIVGEARQLKNPGQFYYYKDHIFIAEQGQGIHVIDNSLPESPRPILFLEISGADNIAVRNDVLYVNNYIDLLAIDLADISAPSLIGRTLDVFDPIWEDINSGQILVEYKLEEVTQVMECHQFQALRNWGNTFVDEVAFDMLSNAPSTGTGGAATGPVTTGVAGSMARFSVIGDYLYSVSDFDLDVISLADPAAPEFKNSINLGWGIETIFPYQDKLFIGSNSGMFIFDNSNPEAPQQLSVFQHARACDPVFVKGDYAYVTLRDGNICAGFINQLDLIDISDLENPQLIESFPMTNPHGLTIRGDHLILCEGASGLKAFDISTPEVLDEKLLAEQTGFHAWDAISLPGQTPVTLVIGEDGFFQYRFDESQGFQLLSHLSVGN